MTKQTPVQIYLPGRLNTAQFRRYSALDGEDFNNPVKEFLGRLEVVNEELLAGSQKLVLAVEQATHVILIPVKGSVALNGPHNGITTFNAGELLIHTVPANHSIHLANPLGADIIRFLQIRIKAGQPVNASSWVLLNFDLKGRRNQLMPIIASAIENKISRQLLFTLHLGQFEDQKEALYKIAGENSLFFVFVIAGAFEVEGNLLGEKEGLALREKQEVKLVATRNNAMVLVVEIAKEA